MIYTVVNLALTGVAVVLIYVLAGNFARIKMYICCLALFSWMVPWGSLQLALPIQGPALLPVVYHAAEQSIAAIQFGSVGAAGTGGLESMERMESLERADGIAPLTLDFIAHYWWLVLGSLGFIYFVNEVMAQQRYLARLRMVSTPLPNVNAEVNTLEINSVRVVESLGNAFTSGLRKPTIWVDSNVLKGNCIGSVLQHENMHIQQKDNFILLLVLLCQRILWWNPVGWVLLGKIRAYMELSCDARCQKNNHQYYSGLAEALLCLQQPVRACVLAMVAEKKFNVERLKQLCEGKPMKMNYWQKICIGLAGCIAVSIIAVPSLAAQKRDTVLIRIVYEDTESESIDRATYELSHEDTTIAALEVLASRLQLNVNEQYQQENYYRELLIRSQTRAQFDQLEATIQQKTFDKFGIEQAAVDEASQLSKPLDVNVSLSLNKSQRQNFSLVATDGNWFGVREGDMVVRIKPLIKGDEVFVFSDITVWENGEIVRQENPSLVFARGEEGQISYDNGSEESAFFAYDVWVKVL